MVDQKTEKIIYDQCVEMCSSEEDCEDVLEYCQRNGMSMPEAARIWERVWADTCERFSEASIDNMIEAQREG